MERIEHLLDGTSTFVRVQGHQVIVVLPEGLPTPERGRRLLNLERALRAHWDSRAEVFLEPTQDRNALRRLRGVQVT